MQILSGFSPLRTAPPRILSPLPAPVLPGRLESTPVPAGLGLKLVSGEEGSLAYAGPSAVRRRLEAAQVTLIGLRHGQTEANARSESGPPVICGQSETPLTAKGRAQAREAAAELLRQLGGDDYLRQAAANPGLLPVIMASPLSRALDTGSALAELVEQRSRQLGCPVQLPIIQDERLLELNPRTDPTSAIEVGRRATGVHPRLINKGAGFLSRALVAPTPQ